VYLLRFADINADAQFINNFDATQNTAAGWNSQGPANAPSYGLQLQNVGTPALGYWSGFAQNTGQGPNACAFAFNAPGGAPLVAIDGSVEMVYVDTLAGNITKDRDGHLQGILDQSVCCAHWPSNRPVSRHGRLHAGHRSLASGVINSVIGMTG
jgi:hypothetical protein